MTAPTMMSSIQRFLIGEPSKTGTLPTKTSGQFGALNQLLGNVQQAGGSQGTYGQAQDYLSKLLSRDPGIYDQFAAPYLQQFQQQTVPQLAERFAGLGGGMGGGALSSSGFGQAIGGAGAQLQSNLAGLFANLQRGASSESLGNYGNLSSLGIGTQALKPYHQQGSTGALGGLFSGLGAGLGQGLGAAGGGGLFSILSSLLGGGNTPQPSDGQKTGLPQG